MNNSLAEVHPELVSEWSEKNEIKPTEVSIGSLKKVIWRCEKGHEWEAAVKRRTINKTGCPYCSGYIFLKPEMKEGNPIRLYSLDEITEIFCKLGLRICNSFADFSGKPSSDNDIQLMVYSIRE